MASTPSSRRASLLHNTARKGTHQLRWASPEQQAIFEYGPAPVVASGGFGAAKTWGFCLKALWLSDVFPRNRGVIARNKWTDLSKTTMPTFFKICPPAAYSQGTRSDSNKILQLNNGSEVLWMHLDDPEIDQVLKGLEINWFLFDQAEDMQEEIFDIALKRLGRWDLAEVPEWIIQREEAAGRPWQWHSPVDGRPIPPTYAMLTCNPDTEFHWIYRRFHPDSREWKEKYAPLGYKMVHMPSWSNRFLPQQNRQELLNADPAYRRRYGDGIWGIPEGQIHTINKDSVVEGNADILQWIRQSCKLRRILDHGDTSPTCCGWMATDDDGNTIFYREYYMPNKLVSDHRVNIYGLSRGERYVDNIADPAIQNKISQTKGGRFSIADEYSDRRGVAPPDTAICWSFGDNDEMGTRNRISELLRIDPEHLNPFTRQKGAPRLYFIKRCDEYPDGCDFIIRELGAQRRAKIGTENGRPIFSDDRDEEIPDHAYDVVRYGIATHSSRIVTPTVIPSANTFDSIRKMANRFNTLANRQLMASQARVTARARFGSR